MLEHERLVAMRAKHPEWLWHRSDTHVMLGVPRSHESLKTVVEPGNSFSPGVGSFGVSTWVYAHRAGRLYAPEQMPLEELHWRFLDGHLPVLISTWRAGAVEVESRLLADGDADLCDVKDFFSVALRSEAGAEVSLYLVVRSFGPAGGPVTHLALGDDGLLVEVNHFPLLYAEDPLDGFGAVSYAQTGEDVGGFLQRGALPPAQAVEDDSTWASGALEYRVRLEPGAARTLHFVLPVKANDPFLTWLERPRRPLRVAEVERDFAARWREGLVIELEVPDERFRDAFYTQLAHLSMFTVHDAPRICPVSYPVWWLRDGAYVVTALDRGGFHEFADRACRAIMHRDAFGGFGAEGDGPGEALWMLAERYLLSRDGAYLREAYPHLRRKAELLLEMRRAERPMRRHAEHIVPKYALCPWNDLLCLPPREGLIMGRMDGHYPIFWVNGFAYAGLLRAARCARALGEIADAERYEAEAAEVRAAMLRAAEAEFGGNERDLASALWPTGWATGFDETVVTKFAEHWERVRCPGGRYAPEPLWTYFEAAQAHNRLLLGERENAWASIEHFLTHHAAPGLYTYHEGEGDENSFLLWQHVRGWDRIGCVTPHGWTASELFHLLRDCLVYEQDEELVIGAGVPESWLRSGRHFGIAHAPSHFGEVSWRYDPAEKTVHVSAARPPARLVVAFPSATWDGPWPTEGLVWIGDRGPAGGGQIGSRG
jgi:hypothetical protein